MLRPVQGWIACLILAAPAQNALAGDEPEQPEPIEEIVVFAERPSLTNDPTALARARLGEIAGGTRVVGPDERNHESNQSIADAIGAVPGVITQNFFGGNDQVRIQMRGSGLQQNPTQRGVLLLQDGLPLSRADGSYIVSSLEPDASNTIEVYRGASGARVGSATLGGAMNFISLTGADVQDLRLALEAGRFGARSARLSYGARSGAWDLRGTLVKTAREGLRDPLNDSERTAFLLNSGYRFSDNLETRVFVDYVDLSFDIPGPITRAALNDNPDAIHTGPRITRNPGGRPPFFLNEPGPNVPRDQPRRDAEKWRLSTRTTYTAGLSEFDLGLTHADTDETFRFPVSAGIRHTDGADVAVDMRYTRYARGAAVVPLVELSAHYISGDHDRSYFHNNAGSRGARFSDHALSADTLSLNAFGTLLIDERWRLTAGLNYVRAHRENDERYALPTRPTLRLGGPPPPPLPPAVPAADTSFSRNYDGLNPSLSLSYAWKPQHMAFVSIARSYEPPTFEDLLAPRGGTPNSGPLGFTTRDLKAQSGYTLELGVRGTHQRLSWDVVAYTARIDDELLSLRDASGVPLGTRNADKTRRDGLELGLGMQFTQRVQGGLSYTYQDFRFDKDPFFGDNKLAGAHPHTINARLAIEPFGGWLVTPNMEWVPKAVAADNANRLYRDDFLLLGLHVRYRTPGGRLSVFLDARNLLDEQYASSSLIFDVAHPTQAAFLPGDPRAVYGGVEVRF